MERGISCLRASFRVVVLRPPSLQVLAGLDRNRKAKTQLNFERQKITDDAQPFGCVDESLCLFLNLTFLYILLILM
jgi:hypothetical protein